MISLLLQVNTQFILFSKDEIQREKDFPEVSEVRLERTASKTINKQKQRGRIILKRWGVVTPNFSRKRKRIYK
tara:strand:- start:1802 stop:2020 length:219 start_codon:yes stop_codon:yes gene_type:complete